MNKNTRVQVSYSAPFHSGRIGYFQFFGEGVSEGVAVLSEEASGNPKTLFAVKKEFAQPTP